MSRVALGLGYVRLTGSGSHELQHVLQRAVRLGALAVCGPVEVERLRGEPPNGAPRELELLPAEPRPGLPFAWFHVLSPICEWPAGSRLVLTVRDVSTWAQRFPVAVRIGWPPVARRECHVSAVCQCVTA